MDIARAVGYPFKDPNFLVKILIGAVINFIPIVNFIAYGYNLRAVKEVMAGREEAMPEWDDWGGDFMRGLMLFAGYLLYFLPVILLSCCQSLLSTAAGSDGGAATVATLISCCFSLIILVYSVLVMPLLMSAGVQYALTEDFSGAFLNFQARYNDVMTHLSDSVIYVLILFLASFVLGIAIFITIFLCLLGLVVAFVGNLTLSHILAQYGLALYGAQGGGQVPPAPSSPGDLAFA